MAWIFIKLVFLGRGFGLYLRFNVKLSQKYAQGCVFALVAANTQDNRLLNIDI
jgi:hypothetical protein